MAIIHARPIQAGSLTCAASPPDQLELMQKKAPEGEVKKDGVVKKGPNAAANKQGNKK